MAQFARPISDLTNQSYTNQAASAVSLFLSIDEVNPDDADYVQSAYGPTSDVYVCGLSSVTDPLSSTDHTVRYRVSKDAASGTQIDLIVQLVQDYVNEGAPGTTIAAWTHTDLSETITTYAQALTSLEADAITNYSGLSLRFVSNQV